VLYYLSSATLFPSLLLLSVSSTMELEQNGPLTKDAKVGVLAGTFSEADIERLGRQRPDAFHTSVAEIGFCFSLLASMFMAVSALPKIITVADAPRRNISSAALD
jgi:hypothetical protein